MLHLNDYQIKQLEEIIELLDEAFYHAVEHEPHHLSNEGNIKFVFNVGSTADRRNNTNKLELTIVIDSYVLGGNQTQHFFSSLDEALIEVRQWHKEEMSYIQTTSDDVRVSEQKPNLQIVK